MFVKVKLAVFIVDVNTVPFRSHFTSGVGIPPEMKVIFTNNHRCNFYQQMGNQCLVFLIND